MGQIDDRPIIYQTKNLIIWYTYIISEWKNITLNTIEARTRDINKSFHNMSQ